MEVSIPVSRFPVELQSYARAAARLGGKQNRVDSEKEVKFLKDNLSKQTKELNQLSEFLKKFNEQVESNNIYYLKKASAKVEDFVQLKDTQLIIGKKSIVIEDKKFADNLVKVLREAIKSHSISTLRENLVSYQDGPLHLAKISLPGKDNKTRFVELTNQNKAIKRWEIAEETYQFILDALDDFLVNNN